MTFAADLARWTRKVEARADTIVRGLAIGLFTRIVLRSPVKTGRFRGNWRVSVGGAPSGTLELNDVDGTATISAATAAAQGFQAGDVVYLFNNLPYGPRLENGWSQQAPNGMVALTAAEFGSILTEASAAAVRAHP